MRAASSRRSRGFTLIELMIVVVIIGILAALAIPRFNMATHKSKLREAEMILSQVYRMQTAYRAQYGEFATSQADLLKVGFAPPQTMKHYVWAGSVDLPLCLTSLGPWPNWEIDQNGAFSDC